LYNLLNDFVALLINNKGVIEKFLTHEDLAKLIGSSRQTVTTTLNQFEKQGLITISKKEITINDISAFKKSGESEL
jgi:CRP-like cAMP-binding protein